MSERSDEIRNMSETVMQILCFTHQLGCSPAGLVVWFMSTAIHCFLSGCAVEFVL